MDHTKQAEYFIVSGSVPKLANYLEKITEEAAEIIKELKQERDEARAERDELAEKAKLLSQGWDKDHGELTLERDKLAAALRDMLYIFDRELSDGTIGRKTCDEARAALAALEK